jgi:pimeloyl-ACP methyl ester carboxylesterase
MAARWRMIAMDCRGHGQTEAKFGPARISFAQFAEDLAMLLDSLNIERAVVGGISMGAGVALAFALAHPERITGLVLVRPAWLDHSFPPNLRWFPLAAGFLQEYPADEAAQRFAQVPEFSELKAASKPAADSLLGQFRRPHARERAGILAGMPASVPVTSLAQCQNCRSLYQSSLTRTTLCTLIPSVSNWQLRSPAPRYLGSLRRHSQKRFTRPTLPAGSRILLSQFKDSFRRKLSIRPLVRQSTHNAANRRDVSQQR